VWIETTNVQVLLASLESGLTTTALFAGPNTHLAEDWRTVGRFETVRLDERDERGGVLFSAADDDEQNETAVGISCAVASPEDVHDVARLAGVEPLVLVDCRPREYRDGTGGGDDAAAGEAPADAWRIIPAENLVAAYGRAPESQLFFFADSCEDARAVLEALNVGVDGVVLRTEDPGEARALAKYISAAAGGGVDAPPPPNADAGASSPKSSPRLDMALAAVTRVEVVGVGDRVCVDCTSAFQPGEGLLVGSFARGLFLAHSECLSSFGYVDPRPFRVNAGPVCSYVLLPGGRAGYLSELRAGDEVLCVASDGTWSTKTVGRVKIERRQMVLVEATLVDGDCENTVDDDDEFRVDALCVDTPEGLKRATTYSVLLQNAETVRLVGDAETGDAVSVSAMRVGDGVLVHRLAGGRHTGIEIAEEGWEER